MKNRWIGGFLLAVALALAACQPQNQGGGSSAEPSEAAPPASAEPMISEEPAESEDDGGGRYDY